MNASIHLLRQTVPAAVHLQVSVPPDHPSTFLGAERSGTGTVVDPSGIILTAHYLVIGAESIEVTFADGTTRPGELVALDFASGLATIRVAAQDLAVASVHAGNDVEVGQDVFLISSVGDGLRVASGAVSSRAPFEAFWEYLLDDALTTTATNPGVGGGPLLDKQGRLIGVVTLSLPEVGKFTLAIPSSYYLAQRSALCGQSTSGAATPRAWVGVTCYTLRNHVVIASLIPGSPAEAAGLRTGDVVLELDGCPISDRSALYRGFWRRQPGDPMRFRVFRNNGTVTIDVVARSAEEFFG